MDRREGRSISMRRPTTKRHRATSTGYISMVLKETSGKKDGSVNLRGIFRIRDSLPGMKKHLTDD
jgi:hypothetical protein